MLNEHYSTPALPTHATFSQRVVFHAKMFIIHLRLQLRSFGGWLLLCAAVPLLAALSVLLINRIWDVPVSILMRDVFAVAKQPVYIGLISNLGILLWATASTIWALGAFVLRRDGATRRLARFCFWSFWFSLFLLLDDALMLHDELLPLLFGIGEGYIIVGMSVIALAYGARFGRQILTETPFAPALLACGFLGASLLYDKTAPFGEIQTLVEDSFKLGGIIFWVVYALAVFDQIWRRRR